MSILEDFSRLPFQVSLKILREFHQFTLPILSREKYDDVIFDSHGYFVKDEFRKIFKLFLSFRIADSRCLTYLPSKLLSLQFEKYEQFPLKICLSMFSTLESLSCIYATSRTLGVLSNNVKYLDMFIEELNDETVTEVNKKKALRSLSLIIDNFDDSFDYFGFQSNNAQIEENGEGEFTGENEGAKGANLNKDEEEKVECPVQLLDLSVLYCENVSGPRISYHVTHFPKLRKVELHQCTLHSRQVANLSSLPNLKKLSLRTCTLPDNVFCLFDNDRIRSLDLSDSKTMVDILVTVQARQTSDLETLILAYLKCLPLDFLKEAFRFPKLKWLDLTSCNAASDKDFVMFVDSILECKEFVPGFTICVCEKEIDKHFTFWTQTVGKRINLFAE